MNVFNKEFKMAVNTTKIISMVNEINLKVRVLHDAHYSASPTGLVNPGESPNANTIYHLFNDGSVSSTKGGDVYGRRSFFQIFSPITEEYKNHFKFPLKGEGFTYAILTNEECVSVREEMKKWLLLYTEEKNKGPDTEFLQSLVTRYEGYLYEKVQKERISTLLEINYVLGCLRSGSDMNVSSDYKETLLMWAAGVSSATIISFFAEKGGDLLLTDLEGRTFIQYVMEPIIASFLRTIRIPKNIFAIPDNAGNTPFHNSIIRKSYTLAKELVICNPEVLEMRNGQGDTPFDILSRDPTEKGVDFISYINSTFKNDFSEG